MGRRGFEAVQRKYNWENEEKNLFRLYEELSVFPRTSAATEVQL